MSAKYITKLLNILMPGGSFLNIEGILKILSQIFEILLSYGVAFGIIIWKLDLYNYFHTSSDILSPQTITVFIYEKGHLVLLSAAVIVLLFDARSAIRRELLILAPALFSQGMTPQRFETIFGHRIIVFVLLITVIIIIGLALFIDNINHFLGVRRDFRLSHHNRDGFCSCDAVRIL